MKTIKTKSSPKKLWLMIQAVLTAIMLFLGGNGQSQAAGLLIADGGFGGVLEIVEHDVRVTINNGIAVTEVTQVFANTEDRQVEALYSFPVPQGASVANFSMWINGKEMTGEVVEKKRAREIYNSYKAKREDPGLLEQVDYKSFEMRIFPIGPKARQKVQIIYYQELEFDHDWATYVYPLATATRSGIDSRVQGRFSVSAEIKSVVPITTLESPSHGKDFLTISHTENFHEASLERRNGDLARDVVLAFQIERPVTGLDLLASNTKGEDGYFALTLTAGQELDKIQTGSDYVFVLDISGSMSSEGKLSTSVNSLQAFIKALGPEDRFEIITFNKRPTTLFNQLEETTADNLTRAITFLESQEARGGTSLQSVFGTVYQYRTADRDLNTVILSDGMTEQGERSVLMEMIRSRPDNVRVFCIGVGNEINRSLLTQIAEDAGGLAAFLSRGDNFERQAKAFQRKLLHPVAANLQISITGVRTYDIEPKELPNLYHGMPVRIYGRYKKGGAAQIQLQAEVNGKVVTTNAELIFPEKEDDNPEIERMWAWHRMEQLKRQHEIAGSQTLIDEIVRLGEGYSITSEYTSFLVLENDSEYRRWKIERRNSTRIKRDRAAQQRLRDQLEELRRKSMNNIGPREQNTAPQKMVASGPVQNINPVNTSPQAANPRSTETGKSRSFDLPNVGGGGAMDPISALMGISLAGGFFLRRRKNK